MCTGVLIFKIFICSVLQLQRIVWTLDLKCSQWQKCKYLSWPLFRMPHASWVLCITFSFISCHSLFVFLYFVYIWFPYFVIIILFISLSYLKKKKKKALSRSLLYIYIYIYFNNHVYYIPFFFFFFFDNHVSYILVFCSNMSSYIWVL